MYKLKYILISVLAIAITGCSQKKDYDTKLVLQIGAHKIQLTRKKNVPELRKEILSYIKTAWENRKSNESEWITVYSVFSKSLKTQGQAQEITSVSTAATDSFRIIRKSDSLFITVRKDDPDKAVSSSSTGNWNVLEVLLNGFLNDSILQHILDNQNPLRTPETLGVSNPLDPRPGRRILDHPAH